MSKIIKGNQARAMDYRKIEAVKLPVFDDNSLQEYQTLELTLSPEEILETAKNEQKKIIKQAKEEAEQLKRLASEQGFQQGFQEGMKSAKEDQEKLQQEFINRFRELESEFNNKQCKLKNEAAKDVTEIALYIAQKLVGDLLNDKQDLIVEIYKLLLPLVTDKKIREIKVNSTDFDIIQDYLKFTNKSEVIPLTVADELDPKTIYIDTEQGYIMKNLNRELEELVGELRSIYG
ncbi:hypothetical protein HYG86_17365 [Alkalicella caledoniensis]|uniref:Flagellar assembly protein FliH/Type III secretion system HrpE domain-containing protein n=1 Tax=Alkalicella caledoniensis TaxID=2731377 RepID=A0A7G9WCK5_ALKCA|nr:FliH/SctL family protein [Alkalicella caledoniensis]QNO16417.1 hypothetical protein HYG86_17365 [Alkalicella caledoniensis]